jgi:4-methyl-5(b-hydroxyethyl)-thiazole monophosphate biosynthesis
MSDKPKRVLCLLAAGFEEIETIAPVDLLRRAGAEVHIASLSGDALVTGRSGVTVQADLALADADTSSYDLLLLPGGPGAKTMRQDGRARDLARAFAAAGKPVAAICAAPTVLFDAGLLEDKRYTAHFSVWNELREALGHERVVQDGLLVTSRGAGTAVEFGLALVSRLFGIDAADQIARSIMV